jgi:hypothetical protein
MPKTDEQILQEITKRIEDKESIRFWNGVRRITLGSVHFASVGCASIVSPGAGSYFVGVLFTLVFCFIVGTYIFPYTYGTFTYTAQSFWSQHTSSYLLPGAILLNVPMGVLIAFASLYYLSCTAAVVLYASMAAIVTCLLTRLFTANSWGWENNKSTIFRLRFPLL